MYLWVVGGVVIAVILVWLAVVSYVLWKQQQLISALLPQLNGQERKSSLLSQFSLTQELLSEVQRKELILSKHTQSIDKEILSHVQKISVSRYNPYGDTGGEQSFSIALLDGKNNGVLLSSLHSRSGTRVYAKEIRNGQSAIKLAKEEEQALIKALQKR